MDEINSEFYDSEIVETSPFIEETTEVIVTDVPTVENDNTVVVGINRDELHEELEYFFDEYLSSDNVETETSTPYSSDEILVDESTTTTYSLEQNVDIMRNGVLSISSVLIFFTLILVCLLIYKVGSWFF